MNRITHLDKQSQDESMQLKAERILSKWHGGKESYPELVKLVMLVKKTGVWNVLTALEIMSDVSMAAADYDYRGTIYGLTRDQWVALHCELECGNIFSNCEDTDEEAC